MKQCDHELELITDTDDQYDGEDGSITTRLIWLCSRCGYTENAEHYLLDDCNEIQNI